MFHRTSFIAGCLAVLMLAPAVHAQEADDDDTPPRPCSQPECRQFDFWLGEWEVTNPKGKPAGTNLIVQALNGCVIEEHWHSASSAFEGKSFNLWDAATGNWHQTWVDNSGQVLLLDGGLVNGSMVLEGTRPSPTPGEADVRHRITWTPKSADEVRQHWETSSDGGENWSTVFDGTYRRKSGEE